MYNARSPRLNYKCPLLTVEEVPHVCMGVHNWFPRAHVAYSTVEFSRFAVFGASRFPGFYMLIMTVLLLVYYIILFDLKLVRTPLNVYFTAFKSSFLSLCTYKLG